jgi:hypothetical protein
MCLLLPLLSMWVQARVVDAVLDRFQSADAEDLPAVARFLLQHAAPGSELKKVLPSCRAALFMHLICCFEEVAGLITRQHWLVV